MIQKLVKKYNGLMLLCSLSLLIALTTSCQEAKLKAAIAIAQKQCPISLGEVGEISSITYGNSKVVYTFSMNEEYTNIDVFQKNPEMLKSSVKTMFANPDKNVKEMLELVIQCDASLKLIYVGKDSGKKATCEIMAAELKDLLNSKQDKSESDQAKLKSQIEMANLQFPMKASEEVTIEKMELTNESAIYICRVDEELCDINSIEKNSETIKQDVIETLSDKADLATQRFLEVCLKCNKNLVYRYIGNQTGNQYDVVISLTELKEITQ